MTVDLYSGTGLFDRIGRIGHLLNQINDAFGGSSAGDFPVELNDIIEEYDGTSNELRDTVDELLTAFTTFQATPTSFRTALRTAAENTLIEMVDSDNPLTARSVAVALAELIRQMETNSESVDASVPTISSLVIGPSNGAITGATQANPVVITSNGHGLSNGDIVSIVNVGGMTEINSRQFYVASATTNTFALRGENGTGHTLYTSGGTWRASHGHGTLITSLLDGAGDTLENVLAENITVKVTDGSTAGSESISILGEVDRTQGDKLHHSWPSGSGTSLTSETVKNPASAGFLTNGDFEDFTANDPDNWTIDTGTAGGTVTQDTADEYKGTSCLEFDGDGAELTAISQDLSSASLVSRTPYPVCVRYKADVVPAAGVLVIDLYDGTNVINDDAGTANSISIDLTASETSYNAATGVFRLPEPVPATVKIRVRLTTAISNTTSAFVDDLIFGPAMTQLYTGGPFVSLIRGDVDMAVDDEHEITVVNARDGAFQELFDRLFQLPATMLPSNSGGSETVADSLIG